MTVTGKTEGEQCSGESREEVTQRVIQGLNCSSFSNFLATVSASRRSAYLPTRTRNTFGPLDPGVVTNEGNPLDERRFAQITW